MFIEALFIKAPNWKQFQYLSTVEGILYSKEMEPTITVCNNMDGSHRHNVEWKKQTQNKHVLYHFIYIKFKNRWIDSSVIEIKIIIHFGKGAGSACEKEQGRLLPFS